MKIRGKILIAFGLYFAITALVGLLVYRELTVRIGDIAAPDSPTAASNVSDKENAAAEETMTHVKRLLLFGMAAVFVTGAALSLHLAESIVTPIRKLQNATKKIALGDFAAKIHNGGSDEIASLSRSIDSMQVILKNVIHSLDDSLKELQEKQSQLVRAEKLAAIGVFASGVAHEINNPLTAVLTFSNLILEKMPEDDPRHEMLRIMSRETIRARNIVRQLLTFAKDSAINPCRFDMNACIRETVNALSLQGILERIDMKIYLYNDLPDAYADPLQMEELFSNIMLNAVQAISPPGTISISTAREGTDMVIIIADSGAGIAEEYLDRIYDPFFTTKGTAGMGLGLAVSYDIIRKHGGNIEVKSRVNNGTTFIIRLPLHEQDQGISS